jgi:capsular polysaccharide biosynthesis protein
MESIGNVAVVLQARLDSVRRSIDSTSDATALLAQRQLEIALSSQVEALGAAANESVYSLTLIDEAQTEPSATVSSVSTSTYMLGIIIGLVVALIIILQFAVLRSRRR